MIADPIPKDIEDEFVKLEEVWFAYPQEVSFEVVVKEHGTTQFQKYYFDMMNKHKQLRKKGIFIN